MIVLEGLGARSRTFIVQLVSAQSCIQSPEEDEQEAFALCSSRIFNTRPCVCVCVCVCELAPVHTHVHACVF